MIYGAGRCDRRSARFIWRHVVHFCDAVATAITLLLRTCTPVFFAAVGDNIK